MIRPAGGSWTRWALNAATVLLGATLNAASATRDRLLGRRRAWRCPDCRCINAPHEWCCYLCGAGHPDDA